MFGRRDAVDLEVCVLVWDVLIVWKIVPCVGK